MFDGESGGNNLDGTGMYRVWMLLDCQKSLCSGYHQTEGNEEDQR